MFLVLVLTFMSVPQVKTASLLTSTNDQNATALINEGNDAKDIDILRQLVNQETLIRVSVVNDVRTALDDVNSVKKNMEILQRKVDSLTEEQKRVNSNCQEKIQDLEKRFSKKIAEIYEDVKLKQDCKDHYTEGKTQSGVYEIHPFENQTQVSVYCDMETEGSGWTAIQRRVGGSVRFNKSWAEYKTGFGNPNDSYWIGNDVIQQLTKGRNSSLYVSITLRNGTTLYELYQQFAISDESGKYKLFLGGPATGTLGDAMLDTGKSTRDLSGMFFSTPDRDNDGAMGPNCAAANEGGWWFNYCHLAYLNGPWAPAMWAAPWYPIVEYGSSVRETRMLIKLH
ncbi:fibroleukin-like [Saccostrea cucullata]|uniref:fibroleukin-like n=1 Tax=Saccostrea cuccullata TaxID=36930 RepID=UPI002ED28C45